MEIGVSTASLFLRYYNEDALTVLDNIDSKICEIFLGSFCEYTKEYGELLKSKIGGLSVHSVHSLNTHFEPQLFSENVRAREDAENIFRNILSSAKLLGAKNYTFHGKARIKKNVNYDRYEVDGKYFAHLTDVANEYGVDLCLENVEWAQYSHVGYFKGVKEYAQNLKACFDVKQARLSGFDYHDYIDEMKGSLNTVHLSDVTENGKVCLPGKGIFDFKELFLYLKSANFNGNMLIEVYKDSFSSLDEIKESLLYLRKIKKEVFGS